MGGGGGGVGVILGFSFESNDIHRCINWRVILGFSFESNDIHRCINCILEELFLTCGFIIGMTYTFYLVLFTVKLLYIVK